MFEPSAAQDSAAEDLALIFDCVEVTPREDGNCGIVCFNYAISTQTGRKGKGLRLGDRFVMNCDGQRA